MNPVRLIIGNKNYSSWSLRAWIALRQFEVGFEERVVPLYRPSPDDHLPILAELSPSGLVPVLQHGDITVWDSLAICEYAASQLSAHLGWPTDPAHMALARSAAAEMHSGFTAMRDALPMNVRARNREVTLDEPAQRDVERIEHLWAQCRSASDSDRWLFGDFGIVDAMFAPVVFRLDRYAVAVTPKTRAYVDFVLADPMICDWIAAAEQEPWTIDSVEVG